MSLNKLPLAGLAGMLVAATLVSCNHKQTPLVSPEPPSQPTASPPLVVSRQAIETMAQQTSPPLQTVPDSSNREPISVSQMAADLKPEFLMDARSHMPFVVLDAPEMAAASDASFMHNQEHVLGISEGTESRAYPTRFLAFHHTINDVIAKTPVAVMYCNVCDSGFRYDPRVDGQTLKFDFFGIYNGIVVMMERATQGVFLIAEGRIVTGPLTGTHLKSGPILDTTWEQWKRLHPKTLVMRPDARFLHYYGSPAETPHQAYTDFPIPYFRASLTRSDQRLPMFTMVFGVTRQSKGGASEFYRAYPLATLEQAGGVVNDAMGGKPLVVFLDSHTAASVAFSRRLGERTLTFHARKQPDGETALYDAQTGTRWNLEGKGEAGPLKGSSLQPFDSHLSRWYGWFASHPSTSIYGRTDPPQIAKLPPVHFPQK